MPGHATAANRAYPAFSGGGSAKHPQFTFHPGKEETYQYLSHILQEVNILFPAKMVHIGGDEVSFGNERWQQDTEVQQLMKREKLNNITDVEHYFIRRMADTLFKLNSEVLAWDEVADADLDPAHTIVCWWRQEKPAQLTTALNKGFRVVLCPRLPFYFDFVQDSTHTKGRKWNKLYNSLENVYRFSIASLPVDAAHRKQVLGIQANVWTETMVTTERLEYMLYPRIYALAEAAWSNGPQKDYKRFEQRLQPHLLLLQQDSLHYYNVLQPAQTPEIKQ